MDLNIVVPVLLFILLSPGAVLTLPPGQSRLTQVVFHAAVFGLVYYLLRRTFAKYY